LIKDGRRFDLIFIDAGHDTMAPFSFHQAAAKSMTGHSTHAVAPEALLGVFRQVHGEVPPPAFILCVAGKSFELGEPLSAASVTHLEQALAFARSLFANPTLEYWRACADRCQIMEECV
jgi:hypothetical protein